MKKLLAVVLMFISGYSFASLEGKGEIVHSYQETYAGVNLSIPRAPDALKDYWDREVGIYLCSGFGSKLPGYRRYPMVIFMGGIRIDLDAFNLDSCKVMRERQDSAIVSGGDAGAMSVSIYFKAKLDKPISPYISFAIGRTSIGTETITITDKAGQKTTFPADGELAAAVRLNAGISLGKPWGIIIEPGYVIAFTKGASTQYFSLSAGIYYTGFGKD